MAQDRGARKIWSLTATTDLRSIAVMERIGLTYVMTLDHPRLPEGHRLRPHVFYRAELTR